jgi:predicted GIY-YIG superfamily endonuclease
LNLNLLGCCLIHWQLTIGNVNHSRNMASHYLGNTKKAIGERFKEHQSKAGARITKVAVERGRSLVWVRTGDGGWNRERELKKLHHNQSLCPICNPLKRRNAARAVALAL